MSRASRSLTPEQAAAAVAEHGSPTAAAHALGVDRRTMRRRLAGDRGHDMTPARALALVREHGNAHRAGLALGLSPATIGRALDPLQLEDIREQDAAGRRRALLAELEDAGWSRSELARRRGVTRQAISAECKARGIISPRSGRRAADLSG